MRSADVVWIAEDHPPIVLEISWAMGPDIAWAVQTLGADRVMLGTDHPVNVAVEIAKITELPLSDADKALVPGGTAEHVSRLAVQELAPAPACSPRALCGAPAMRSLEQARELPARAE